jgi:hypothetical protein
VNPVGSQTGAKARDGSSGNLRVPTHIHGLDVVSIAYLIRGIMDLVGIEFDLDGRLRSGATDWTR